MDRIREFIPDARIGKIQAKIVDIENKDIPSAIESYQKAEAITTDEKVKTYIHYQLSKLLPSKDDDVRDAEATVPSSPSKKIQKSQEITNKFNLGFIYIFIFEIRYCSSKNSYINFRNFSNFLIHFVC